MKALSARKFRILRQDLSKEIRYIAPWSRPSRIIFDHQPKCGGLSLSAYLETHYPRRKIFSINGTNPMESISQFKTLPRHKRHGYALVKGHNAIGLLDHVHPKCLKVTILREPVDRIVSHYYYVKQEPLHYLHSTILESGMSLKDYVTSGLSIEFRNWYTTYFSGLTISEAEQAQEEAVAKAVEVALNSYDLIGFLDNFSAFIKVLKSKACLKYEYRNKRVNVTQNRPSLENVPQSAIETIKEANRLDIIFYERIKQAVGR
jgi:sulfotransferase famil protein